MLQKPTNQKFATQKKASEQIEKANYYQNILFPKLFPNHSDTLQSVKYNKAVYYTLSFKATNEILSNSKIIQSCAYKAYLSNFEVSKIGNGLFKRQIQVGLPYLFISQRVSEVFDIQLIEFQEKDQSINDNQGKRKLYIIHYFLNNEQNSLKWTHFAECYTFHQTYFEYSVTAVINGEDNFFGTNKKLFEEYLKKIQLQQFPKKMQGLLLQQQINLKLQIQKSSDPAYSQQHRVINRIKPQNIKFYYALQKQFPQCDENFICRYLIAKEYNLNETRKCIKQYMEWKTKIISQWKYDDFQEFLSAGIFTYLGEDRSGRPVVLNKACKVKVDEFDIEKYSYFYIYYLEIYIPSLMRGNVSQIMIIADVQNLSSSNFKLALTRRNMEDNLKYSPERQYKIIGVNVSSFALYWWRLFSPLIPKKSLQKIVVAGNKKDEIFEALENEMPPQIIPVYLGGKNPVQIQI